MAEPAYWKKGDRDPDHGKPHRHVREKIRLVLAGATYEETLAAIWHVADKYPVEVLDALVGDDETA